MPLRYGMNPHQTPAQLYTLQPKLPLTGKGCMFGCMVCCVSIIYIIRVYSLFYVPWILINACHVVTSIISPRIVSPPKNSLRSTPLTPATTDVFTVSIVLLFPECYNVGIIYYPAFSHWLLSLSSMH